MDFTPLHPRSQLIIVYQKISQQPKALRKQTADDLNNQDTLPLVLDQPRMILPFLAAIYLFNNMVENKGSSSPVFFDENNDGSPPSPPPIVHAAFASSPPAYNDIPRSRSPYGTESSTSPTASVTEHDRMVASGTTGAVLGLLLGGPFLSCILGFGSAYATQKDGAVGDSARALGDVGIVAKKKFQDVDRDHHVVEKSKVAAQQAWNKAKALDREHHILEHIKKAIIFSVQEIVRFVKEHRLLEKGVSLAGKGYEYAARKLSDESGSDEPQHQQERSARRAAS